MGTDRTIPDFSIRPRQNGSFAALLISMSSFLSCNAWVFSRFQYWLSRSARVSMEKGIRLSGEW